LLSVRLSGKILTLFFFFKEEAAYKKSKPVVSAIFRSKFEFWIIPLFPLFAQVVPAVKSQLSSILFLQHVVLVVFENSVGFIVQYRRLYVL